MNLIPFEEFKKRQYDVVADKGLIKTVPLILSPSNYYTCFNTLRAYDCYTADIILTQSLLNEFFEPVEYFSYVEFDTETNKFITYYQIYKRKGLDYLIFIDSERYDGNQAEYLQDQFILSSIYYDSTDSKLSQEISKDMNFIFSKTNQKKEAKMMVVLKTTHGYLFKRRKIKPYIVDISKNYNDDFLEVYDSIVHSLKTEEKGITLLHGLAGTGKTNLIRHLTTVIPDKNFVFIPVSMIPHLTDPTFLSSLMDNKGAILVLEDSEKFLKDREASGENSVVSAILNLSDGILSDILGVQIICTFNADLGKVDDALLREGRLTAEYEFGKLSLDKTQAIAKELGVEVDKPMTLAEIYNIKNVAHRNQVKTKQIGFGK